MVESSDKDQGENKFYEVKIFSIPFSLEAIKENITINTNPLLNLQRNK